MSNIDKLKKKAAEFEQKKQYQKALELYQQVLDFSRSSEEERDVPLYNRVGDLHFRLGNSEEAISYYEKAVDLYAEGGFFNNAIALCNKILRYSPNRSVAYYKLGLISAKKGFNSDAKQNFLEYADRMQKVGKLDEAFRALKEFADLCPGQDDVRLMLAEQLARADRKPEALEQLQFLYETLESEGRATEAAATLERMKTLDPGFVPRKVVTPRQRKKDGLVFLDLEYTDDALARRTPPPSPRFVPDPDAPSVRANGPIALVEGFEQTSFADNEPNPKAGAGGEAPSESEQALPPRKTPVRRTPARKTPARRTPVRGTPAAGMPPIELAPMVEDPPEVTAPTAIDPPLVDPLAGLDVIVPPIAAGSFSQQAADVPDTDDGFVDLAQWLEDTRTPQSTRMVAHDEEPEDNQQKDFAEMLEKFKLGVSRSVDETDFDSHYDLGIAFREMGLLDEAISAFQKATRGSGYRIRASEALGECFIEKGQPAVAQKVLDRILDEPELKEDALIGVFYLLGRAAEDLDNPAEASAYYHRVIAVDMGFRDAGQRLSSLTQLSK